MVTVIALANQKGGVGKTTTSTALAAGLTNRGFEVLAIDCDPQGNFSSTAAVEENENAKTLYDLFKMDTELLQEEPIIVEEAIQHFTQFDIIPADIMLAGVDQELSSQIGKEKRLKEILYPIADQYDYIIIDTPPSFGTLTINAMTAADQIIIPTHAGIYATKGMVQLDTTINSVRKYCNNNLIVAGILITRYNPRTNISKDMKELIEMIGKELRIPIFETYIRSSVSVEEAQAQKKDVFSHDSDSTVSRDYDTFIDEYLSKFNSSQKKRGE